MITLYINSDGSQKSTRKKTGANWRVYKIFGDIEEYKYFVNGQKTTKVATKKAVKKAVKKVSKTK